MRLGLLYLIITIIANLNAQQIKILKPKEIVFSTPFSILIDIEDEKILSLSTQSISGSDFEVISLKIEDKKATAHLIPFNVGVSTLPSLTIITNTGREIKTPPLPLEIKPLYNPKEDDEIKDIAPIFEFRWWLNLLIFVIILLLLLIYLIYRMRSKKDLTQQVVIDLRSPYEKAMEKIKDLISKKLIEQDRVKEYYTELSDIVRVYIEEEFKTPATQLTTNELIKTLKNELNIEIIVKMREFFEVADLVKFAKYLPEIERINKNTQEAEILLNIMNNYISEKRKKEEEKLKNEVLKK